MGSLIVLAILIAAIVYVISLYNRLVELRNRVKNAFAQIDVQLTRRHDLVPNLVETVKAYMQHERDTLEAVVSARNLAVAGLKAAGTDIGDAGAMRQLGGAESALGGALSRLLAVAEAYPELKASQNMQQLSEELTSTENRVAFARQSYNDSVMDYNTATEVFPGNLVASKFAFKPGTPLEIEDPAKRAAPVVKF